jgi:hypothetical protein
MGFGGHIAEQQYSAMNVRFGSKADMGRHRGFPIGMPMIAKLENDYYGFGQRGVFFINNTISGASGPLDTKRNSQVIKRA